MIKAINHGLTGRKYELFTDKTDNIESQLHKACQSSLCTDNYCKLHK